MRIASKYLNHHTVNTGHSRKSYRSEVAEDLGLRNHVAALLNSRVPIPGFPKYFAEGSQNNSCISVSVYRSRTLLVRFVVAARNDFSAAEEFKRLLEPSHAGENDEPLAPYCSVTIADQPPADLLEFVWIADYERCVAWEWLAMEAEFAGASNVGVRP